MLLATLWATTLLLLTGVASTSDSPLPPLLTSKSFKPTLQKTKLSLIEFYSPYCSHCKAFAPTWESTYLDFANDSEIYKVQMLQVNCIESGDLCNEEKILAYPSIKLYGPDGFIQNYPNGMKRTKENMIEFMKEQSLDIAEAGGNGVAVESKSELITTEQMIKLLAEVNKVPYLISFWPSYDLEDLNNLDWHKFESSDYYEESLEFQRSWSIISNTLSAMDIKIGHFNCFKNKKICKEFGIESDFIPKVKLVLPNMEAAKVISYEKNDLSIKNIVKFAKHTLEISKFNRIDSIQLIDGSQIKTKLKPLSGLPEKSENTFIYLYDDKLTVQEDFQILPYLIPEFAKYENTNFFVSNDSNILKIMEFQHRNIANAINNLKENNFQFNEDKFIINTMTTLPTILCFKEFSLLSNVYQSFGPMDIRDEHRVKSYIRENSSPFITEITEKNYKELIKDQLSIIIVDSKDSNVKKLDEFILGVHKFEELKSNFTYSKLLEGREEKYDKANDYKKNDDYKKMVKTLKTEVRQPNLPITRYVYLDLSKNDNLLGKIGITVNNESYKSGDVVILKNGFYYSKDSQGEPLSTDPNQLSRTLSIINKMAKGKQLHKNLIKSPFGVRFRILDNIHQFGIWGYMFAMFVVIALVKGVKSRRTRRHTEGNYLPMFEEKKD